jgi:hypothetical protein
MSACATSGGYQPQGDGSFFWIKTGGCRADSSVTLTMTQSVEFWSSVTLSAGTVIQSTTTSSNGVTKVFNLRAGAQDRVGISVPASLNIDPSTLTS